MRILRFAVPVVVAAGLLLTGTHDAYAQKKKTAPTKPSTTTQQPSAQPTPPSVTTPKMGNSLKDLLSKFKGELTTLGVLLQVEADYFTVEDDGTTVVYPMSTIKYIKVIKPEARAAEEDEEEEEEEEEPEAKPKLEIRL